jgi:CubicO group peptidase (beta-lactamase class C family)
MQLAPSRRTVLGLLGAMPLAAGAGLATPEPSQAATAAPDRPRPVSRDLLPGGAYDRFVAQQAGQDEFSGTILLVHRGRTVLARSYGMANKQQSIPNGPDTIFQLASMGKIFCGIAAGQLAAQGRIECSAPLGTYLDGFPAQIAATVTVHQMFTHTSGMTNYQSSPSWQAESKTWTTPAEEFADTMAVIRSQPLLFTPGTGYTYSNSGYYATGAIVAQVNGRPFGDYVRQHVFAAAGMTRTDYYTQAQILANPDIAHGYGPRQPDGTRLDLTTRPNTTRATGGGGGAGGGQSSAPDLVRLAYALQQGRLLDPAYTQLITNGKYPLGPGELSDQPPSQSIMSGYGFEERIVNNQRVFGHGGASPQPGGIATDLSIYPDLDWVTVILSNYYIDTKPYLQLQDQLITWHAG